MFALPFELKKTTIIDKPIGEVFKAVADFATWPKWSPWHCQEPDCKYTVKGTPATTGHSQAWEGKFIGSGEMTLTKAENNKSLEYDLQFLKPWKSESKTQFRFEGQGNKTQITWSMQGSVPVFIFFMRKMMTAWIGNDYERGLLMLKEYVEQGKVLSKVDVKGLVDRNGFFFIGKRNSCSTKDLGTIMSADFDNLNRLINQGKLPKPDFGFSFYHKFDMIKQTCDYTAALAYSTKPTTIPEGLYSGSVDEHKAFEVDHFGPYRHLGNAWSTAMGRQRTLKKKPLKSVDAYEIYRTMPGTIPDERIHTEIYLPLKS